MPVTVTHCPPFKGEPFAVKVFDDAQTTARYYWELLDAETKSPCWPRRLTAGPGRSAWRLLKSWRGEYKNPFKMERAKSARPPLRKRSARLADYGKFIAEAPACLAVF